MSTTIYDIAKAANVSTATVSRVINGSSNVNESTRAAVLEVIRKSDYMPSAVAQGLSGKSMNMIGILAADCQSVFLAQAVHHLESFLRTKDYITLLSCTGYSYEEKKKRVNVLLSKGVDALILVGSGYVYQDDTMNSYIREAADKVPIILINAFIAHPNIYCFACDDRKAVHEAAEWLYHTGSKNIKFFYNQKTYSGTCKLAGFNEALRRHNQDWQDSSIYFPFELPTVDDICSFLNSLDDDSRRFDAVIASDDNLAVGMIKYCKKKGIIIPDQCRIIGFNNSSIAQLCEPELSSIDNNLEKMCHDSVEALECILEKKTQQHNIFFDAKLVLRETT